MSIEFMELDDHKKIPFHTLYWKRQKLKDGIWDIRDCQPILIFIHWMNLIGALMIAIIMVTSDEFGQFDDRFPWWFYTPLLFISLSIMTCNSGFVIDSVRQRMWIWVRIFFFRKTIYIPPKDFCNWHIFINKEKKDGTKVNWLGFYQWSVYLQVSTRMVNVFKGTEEEADIYASNMEEFLHSDLTMWNPPSGQIPNQSHHQLLLLFPIIFGMLLLMLWVLYM